MVLWPLLDTFWLLVVVFDSFLLLLTKLLLLAASGHHCHSWLLFGQLWSLLRRFWPILDWTFCSCLAAFGCFWPLIFNTRIPTSAPVTASTSVPESASVPASPHPHIPTSTPCTPIAASVPVHAPPPPQDASPIRSNPTNASHRINTNPWDPPLPTQKNTPIFAPGGGKTGILRNFKGF